MKCSMVTECWEKILQLDPRSLVDAPSPLINIEPYCVAFDLPSLPLPETRPETLSDIPATEPGFRTLTDDILLSLRRHIYARTDLATVSTWTETLLRFCEVRYRTLRERSKQCCESRAAARQRLLHLAAMLMDQAIYASDVRLLNIVLKLADIGWVLNRSRIRAKLDRNGRHLVSALFQFRIVLMTEYAMQRLYRGEAL